MALKGMTRLPVAVVAPALQGGALLDLEDQRISLERGSHVDVVRGVGDFRLATVGPTTCPGPAVLRFHVTDAPAPDANSAPRPWTDSALIRTVRNARNTAGAHKRFARRAGRPLRSATPERGRHALPGVGRGGRDNPDRPLTTRRAQCAKYPR